MAYMYRISRLRVVTTTLLFLSLIGLANAKVPAIIVFGDSTVDSGNNNMIATILKANFPPYGRDFVNGQPTGRFSNGKLPPDFISEAFGLKPTIPAYLDPTYGIADFATGVCFASAGTGYDNATSNVLNVIPLWKEVEYYKEYQQKLKAYVGKDNANEIITESLYVISIGTNDWLENYYVLPNRKSQYTVQQYQDFLVERAANFIRQLYSLGARKISFTGLCPMGCLPLERTANFSNHRECIEEYNNVALEFNEKLKKMVDSSNKELPRLKMVLYSPYDIFNQMISNGSAFGFEVTDRACCATGTYEMSYLCNKINPFTCTDASKFIFWDAFHPTETTNKIISDQLVKNVLLPAFSS